MKEGLRVLEEISRFVLENRSLTASLKNIRHKIDSSLKNAVERGLLLKGRMSSSDVGMTIYCDELKRSSCQDIFFANMQRVKESLRVLEEFIKLKNIKAAVKIKKIRYEAYTLEKKFYDAIRIRKK